MLEDDLRAAARIQDPAGVLSVYVGVQPEGDPGESRAWELEVRRALEELRARPDLPALGDRLDDLARVLDALLSPTESGRGRALFAGLSGGDPVAATANGPFPTIAGVGWAARLLPLALAAARERPAGVAVVDSEQLRILEWHPASAAELRSLQVDEGGERRELLGPAASHPRGGRPEAGSGFRSGQQRDLFEQRAQSSRERYLAQVSDLAELARERQWQEIVVGGDERLAGALADGLAGPEAPDVIHERRTLSWLSPAELARELAPEIEARRSCREQELYERAKEEALAGGRGALGADDVLQALAEGRVEMLVLPGNVELEGSVTPDGQLVAGSEVPPGVSPERLVPEPHLADRMLQRALETDAAVVVIGEGDDVAALLRW